MKNVSQMALHLSPFRCRILPIMAGELDHLKIYNHICMIYHHWSYQIETGLKIIWNHKNWTCRDIWSSCFYGYQHILEYLEFPAIPPKKQAVTLFTTIAEQIEKWFKIMWISCRILPKWLDDHCVPYPEHWQLFLLLVGLDWYCSTGST